jgi:hypothetical protein
MAIAVDIFIAIIKSLEHAYCLAHYSHYPILLGIDLTN